MIQFANDVAMCVNNNKGFHGNHGHNHGGKRGNSKKERLLCTYCALTGHIVDKCYKFHGYPLGYKPKGGNKAMTNQVSTIFPPGNFGLDGFPSPLNAGLPTVGALPTGVLPNVSAQSDIVPASQNFFGLHLWVLICKLVHKLPCLNALFLRPNVSSSLTF